MSQERLIPKYISDGLPKQSPETLRAIARQAERLADEKEQEAEEKLNKNAVEEEPDDDLERDDAPAGATLTVKTIHEDDYYYWQWRASDGKVKSEYIKPVNPKE